MHHSLEFIKSSMFWHCSVKIQPFQVACKNILLCSHLTLLFNTALHPLVSSLTFCIKVIHKYMHDKT